MTPVPASTSWPGPSIRGPPIPPAHPGRRGTRATRIAVRGREPEPAPRPQRPALARGAPLGQEEACAGDLVEKTRSLRILTAINMCFKVCPPPDFSCPAAPPSGRLPAGVIAEGASGVRRQVANRGFDRLNTRMQEWTSSAGQLSRVRYRRFFALADFDLAGLPSGLELKIGGRYRLWTHPDLPVTQRSSRGTELTLIGYLIDPFDSEGRDGDLVEGLVAALANIELAGVFGLSERFGGRWVLVARRGERVIIHHDPAGLRQVFYADRSTEWIMCASQPGMISEQLGLPLSPEAIRLASSFKHREYYWPGDRCVVSGVRQLLPNHYLALPAREPHRFWPARRLEERPLDEVVEEAGRILRGLVEGGASRFSLALPVTAGLDSRVLLAASRDVRSQVFYYTFLVGSMDETSPDLVVPKRLLARLGLQHHVLDCRTGPVEPGFTDISRSNVVGAHDDWGLIAGRLLGKYPEDFVNVSGFCSEIARRFYYGLNYPDFEIGPEALVRLASMRPNSFATNAYAEWIVEAQAACCGLGVDILDLFYWEDRMGNWAATAQAEGDLIQESFTPFNCRSLLSSLLSVDRRHRRAPIYELHRRLVKRLWPAAFAEPINPLPPHLRVAEGLRSMLIRLGLYDPLRGLYRGIRGRSGVGPVE